MLCGWCGVWEGQEVGGGSRIGGNGTGWRTRRKGKVKALMLYYLSEAKPRLRYSVGVHGLTSSYPTV